MAKPNIIANGGSPGVKASVAASSSVTLTLDSTVGLRSTQWTVLSTDETSSVGDYTLVQSGSLGQTATFTSLTAGTAVLIEVQINNGLVRSRADRENTTNTVKVFVPTTEGLEVGCAGETYESDSTFGTTGILNQPIRLLNGFTTSLYENDLKRADASATSNVAITGDPSPMDGVTVVTGDIVLLLGQTTTHQNGLWSVDTAGAWTRPNNFATTASVQGSVIAVVKGTLRAGYIYQNTNVNDPTIGTTALTFARLPDKFDRADLALASASPGNAILTRYGSASELNASYLVSNSTNPALGGFVRCIKNVVGLAFRNNANSSDLQAIAMDATDVIRVGSAQVANVVANVVAGGEVKFVNDAVTFLRHALIGTIFGRTATMNMTQEAASGALGSDATIEAQAGDTGFDGGYLRLYAGTPGAGGLANGIVLDTKAGSTSSGRLSINGGAFGEFVGIVYDDSDARTTIEVSGNFAKFTAKIVEFDTENMSLFLSPGSFGGGKEMLFIANTTNTPGSNPVGGGLIYVEAGALRYKGTSGTVTNLAPA